MKTLSSDSNFVLPLTNIHSSLTFGELWNEQICFVWKLYSRVGLWSLCCQYIWTVMVLVPGIWYWYLGFGTGTWDLVLVHNATLSCSYKTCCRCPPIHIIQSSTIGLWSFLDTASETSQTQHTVGVELSPNFKLCFSAVCGFTHGYVYIYITSAGFVLGSCGFKLSETQHIGTCLQHCRSMQQWVVHLFSQETAVQGDRLTRQTLVFLQIVT